MVEGAVMIEDAAPIRKSSPSRPRTRLAIGRDLIEHLVPDVIVADHDHANTIFIQLPIRIEDDRVLSVCGQVSQNQQSLYEDSSHYHY